nr:hypothetical protein [Catenulispora pinistramenti]
MASGVRNSWEALAMNRRCAWKAASNRPSRPSIVVASSVISSRGPASARRSCRFCSEILRVRNVMVRRGLRTRPATIQPSRADITAIAASTPADCAAAARTVAQVGLTVPVAGRKTRSTSDMPGTGDGGDGGAGSNVTRIGLRNTRYSATASRTMPEARKSVA